MTDTSTSREVAIASAPEGTKTGLAPPEPRRTGSAPGDDGISGAAVKIDVRQKLFVELFQQRRHVGLGQPGFFKHDHRARHRAVRQVVKVNRRDVRAIALRQQPFRGRRP